MPAGIVKKTIRYLLDSKYRFIINARELKKYDGMSDPEYLHRMFDSLMGYRPNLQKPVTFNEKLQWLKLYDRRAEYVTMVDKVAVKKFAADVIGEQYIIPNIGVWSDPDEIDFESLPDRFVLKCNHNSGLGMAICHDKSKLDIQKVKQELRRGLAQDYYLTCREWPYKEVSRKILAEQYLENTERGGLTDYKIHCFNGTARFVLVCQDRFSADGLTEDFFTPEWEHMPMKRPGIPNAATPIPKPEGLAEMLSLAEKLSADIPFVRVDLYYVDGRIYFSELTFFPASGFAPFEPGDWDRTLGSWLRLSGR